VPLAADIAGCGSTLAWALRSMRDRREMEAALLQALLKDAQLTVATVYNEAASL
jgi:hypothetical protein